MRVKNIIKGTDYSKTGARLARVFLLISVVLKQFQRAVYSLCRCQFGNYYEKREKEEKPCQKLLLNKATCTVFFFFLRNLISSQGSFFSYLKKIFSEDFLGCPVAGSLCSQCRGPGQGTRSYMLQLRHSTTK